MSSSTLLRYFHVMKFYAFNDCRDFLVANDGIFFLSLDFNLLLLQKKWSIIHYTIVE